MLRKNSKEAQKSAKKTIKLKKESLRKLIFYIEIKKIFNPLSLSIKAITQGNMEGAKIYAENSIRNKNQALNFRRMGSRVDAVAQRVQTALSTKRVTQSMAGVVKSMEAAMNSMNLEQVRLSSHSLFLFLINFIRYLG